MNKLYDIRLTFEKDEISIDAKSDIYGWQEMIKNYYTITSYNKKITKKIIDNLSDKKKFCVYYKAIPHKMPNDILTFLTYRFCDASDTTCIEYSDLPNHVSMQRSIKGRFGFYRVSDLYFCFDSIDEYINLFEEIFSILEIYENNMTSSSYYEHLEKMRYRNLKKEGNTIYYSIIKNDKTHTKKSAMTCINR